jgi:DNA-binding transcriptional MerR regulator
METYITCGQAAKRLRVSISTLKRWVQEPGLNMDALRNHNGWRLFSEEQIELLKDFKRNLKRNGKRFNELTLLPINDDNAEKPFHGNKALSQM